MEMTYIKKLNQITRSDLSEVGGKAASLGELIQTGFPVPEGFVVTTQTYKDFYKKHLSLDIKKEVRKTFKDLNVKRVAVRSSAMVEDSQQASWAGQLESYLNITEDELIDAIKKCWKSIHAERAVSYAKQQKIPASKLTVAVIIQKMVTSESSGVLFTRNPVTNNANEIMIEAGYGLGELIVQGEITPDNYVINKNTFKLISQSKGSQQIMLSYRNNATSKMPVPFDLVNRRVLSYEQMVTLAKLGKKIEKLYGYPQDIEWAIEKGKIFIIQSRPITTLKI